MLNENLNNTSDWRNKLDELESLPGEAMHNKNASWEKLHEKLKGKKSDRKVMWYWIAAASVFLVLIISLLNQNKEIHQVVKNKIETKQSNPINSSLINKKDPANISIPVSPGKNKIVVFENKKTKTKTIISPKIKSISRVADTVSNQNAIAQSVDIESQPVHNSLNLASVIPAKKKLKVVHINELGDPVEESPDVARSADIHSFQFKLANGEAYINTSGTSKATTFAIFKTKASPN
jgi:hypothetical protein